ncbi:MAG: potassium-transporting ATPase subunit KdpC [Luteimonas sp.]
MSRPATILHDGGAMRAALVFTVVILAGFGALYSLVGAGLGGVIFPTQARGSLIERDGSIVGSSLVAQPFTHARYFQPRPSAAKYDPMAAAGSNQSRSNPDMRKRVDEAIAEVAKRDGVAAADVPADLVTQSGGGLDPDISPAGAQLQIARVATARGLSPDAVARLVAEHTTPRQFGVLGEPRVNVLELNIALDAAR